jgi:predicted SnoaL-like aldol condensation-catalyzing enzyme
LEGSAATRPHRSGRARRSRLARGLHQVFPFWAQAIAAGRLRDAITADKAAAAASQLADATQKEGRLGNKQANKALVRAFVDDILVAGKMDKLAGYFDGDNYIQHNPQIVDRLSGLGAALEAMAKQGVTMKYDRIHKVLGEGNFVLVVSEGSFGGRHTSFYDLFRVEKGKIAEHWDTVETIPPREQWKNSNGKF